MVIWVSRCSRHKHSQCPHYRKKRAFELGRQSAGIKLCAKRIHTVCTRGGNTKYGALRLDHGNFAWASENVTLETRLIGIVRTPLVLLYPCDGC